MAPSGQYLEAERATGVDRLSRQAGLADARFTLQHEDGRLATSSSTQATMNDLPFRIPPDQRLGGGGPRLNGPGGPVCLNRSVVAFYTERGELGEMNPASGGPPRSPVAKHLVPGGLHQPGGQVDARPDDGARSEHVSPVKTGEDPSGRYADPVVEADVEKGLIERLTCLHGARSASSSWTNGGNPKTPRRVSALSSARIPVRVPS